MYRPVAASPSLLELKIKRLSSAAMNGWELLMPARLISLGRISTWA